VGAYAHTLGAATAGAPCTTTTAAARRRKRERRGTCEVRSRGRGNTETIPKAEGVELLGFKGANGDRWALPWLWPMAHERE